MQKPVSLLLALSFLGFSSDVALGEDSSNSGIEQAISSQDFADLFRKFSNVEEPVTKSDKFIPFKFDGKVKSSDLLSKGHDMSVLYSALYNLAKTLEKNEFETTDEYQGRLKSNNDYKVFSEKYGNTFLIIPYNYANSFDLELRYNADTHKMSVIATLKHFYLEKLTENSYKYGYNPMVWHYTGAYQYTENFAAYCTFNSEIVMDSERAKSLKIGNNIGIAVKFSIAPSLPTLKKTGHVGPIYTRKIHEQKEILTYPGFTTVVSKYWKYGDLKLSIENYTNWADAMIYVFDKRDGEIISSETCMERKI